MTARAPLVLAFVALFAAAQSLHARFAAACSPVISGTAEAARIPDQPDTEPPTLTQVGFELSRGWGGDSDSCADLGRLTLFPTAWDDQAESDELRYRVEVVSGVAPVDVPSNPLALTYALSFVWLDGATDLQEPLDFVLRVRAVDLVDKESAPLDVRIEDDGYGRTEGCIVAIAPPGAEVRTASWGALLLGLLACLGVRRARVATHPR